VKAGASAVAFVVAAGRLRPNFPNHSGTDSRDSRRNRWRGRVLQASWPRNFSQVAHYA